MQAAMFIQRQPCDSQMFYVHESHFWRLSGMPIRYTNDIDVRFCEGFVPKVIPSSELDMITGTSYNKNS